MPLTHYNCSRVQYKHLNSTYRHGFRPKHSTYWMNWSPFWISCQRPSLSWNAPDIAASCLFQYPLVCHLKKVHKWRHHWTHDTWKPDSEDIPLKPQQLLPVADFFIHQAIKQSLDSLFLLSAVLWSHRCNFRSVALKKVWWLRNIVTLWEID